MPATRRLGTIPSNGSDPSFQSVEQSVNTDIASLLDEEANTNNDDSTSIPDVEILSNPKGSTWYASVFIVVNAALGAGLLDFPLAFHQSGGIAVAIIIQVALLVFIVGALLILAYCSDVHKSSTYQDVVRSMCGKGAQAVCSAIIVVYAYGQCTTYFIIVGDQMDKFFSCDKIYGPGFDLKWYLNRRFTITVSSLLLILPLCYPKRIDFLKYVSAAGVGSVLYVVVLVIVMYFQQEVHPTDIRTHPDNVSQVFLVVPVICFAYQCHISVVPVYSCLAKRTQKEFIKTLMIALTICVFAYTVTAPFGYLTFGSKVKADILSSYEPTPAVLVGGILIALKMIASYPILLFVGRAAFDSLWAAWFKLSPVELETNERSRRIVMASVWFFSSLGVSIVVPDISVVINMLGGLAVLFIFTFPGCCLLQVVLQGYIKYEEKKVKYILLLAMALFYLVISAFIFGVVTTQIIYADINPMSNVNPPAAHSPDAARSLLLSMQA